MPYGTAFHLYADCICSAFFRILMPAFVFVEFPLEEDESKSINRPVIVLDENILGVLSVKITKHKARKEDPYDIPIIYWEEASLRLASTARVSKVTLLTKDSFIFKIGNLHPDDLSRIEDMYRKFLKDNGAI